MSKVGITHVRGMCSVGGRRTTEQPRPQAPRVYPEKLEGSQTLLIPKPLQPQTGFYNIQIADALVLLHYILKLKQSEWNI